MEKKTDTNVFENARAIRFSPDKLRDARLAAFPDISLSRFARDVLGITPQRVSAYETGKDNPSPTMLAQLCYLLKTDLLSMTDRAG